MILRVGCGVLRFGSLGRPLLRIISSCGSAFAVGLRVAGPGLAGFASSSGACSSSYAPAFSCQLFVGFGTRLKSRFLLTTAPPL